MSILIYIVRNLRDKDLNPFRTSYYLPQKVIYRKNLTRSTFGLSHGALVKGNVFLIAYDASSLINFGVKDFC